MCMYIVTLSGFGPIITVLGTEFRFRVRRTITLQTKGSVIDNKAQRDKSRVLAGFQLN